MNDTVSSFEDNLDCPPARIGGCTKFIVLSTLELLLWKLYKVNGKISFFYVVIMCINIINLQHLQMLMLVMAILMLTKIAIHPMLLIQMETARILMVLTRTAMRPMLLMVSRLT